MEVDQVHAELQALKRRLEPLLQDYEDHAGASGRRREEADRAGALSRLDAGDLDGAGKIIGLDRSHGGKEEDESYERRLRAHFVGADAAGATGGAAEDGAGKGGGEGA